MNYLPTQLFLKEKVIYIRLGQKMRQLKKIQEFWEIELELGTRVNKGRGFYSKIIFSNLHNAAFHQISSIFTIAQNSVKRTYFLGTATI